MPPCDRWSGSRQPLPRDDPCALGAAPAAAIHAQAELIADWLDTLAAADFDRPSVLPGWDVRTLTGHVGTRPRGAVRATGNAVRAAGDRCRRVRDPLPAGRRDDRGEHAEPHRGAYAGGTDRRAAQGRGSPAGDYRGVASDNPADATRATARRRLAQHPAGRAGGARRRPVPLRARSGSGGDATEPRSPSPCDCSPRSSPPGRPAGPSRCGSRRSSRSRRSPGSGTPEARRPTSWRPIR